jgi:hypothetical protein
MKLLYGWPLAEETCTVYLKSCAHQYRMLDLATFIISVGGSPNKNVLSDR